MRKGNIKVLIFLIAILSLVIGYAVVTTGLTIDGTIATGVVTYDVKIENIQPLENRAIINQPAYIKDSNRNEIEFDIELSHIGDEYRFQYDVVNHGKLGAKLSDIEYDIDAHEDIFSIKMLYADSLTEVNIDDYFPAGSTTPIIFETRYRLADDIDDESVIETAIDVHWYVTMSFENTTDAIYYSTHGDNRNYSKILKQEARVIGPDSKNKTIGLNVFENTLDDPNPIFFFYQSYSFYSIKNYIMFADKCWRIVRTTSDGGLKLVYKGTTCSSTGSYIAGSNLTNSPYIGSLRKQKLEMWYFKFLIKYQAYLSDEPFCATTNIDNYEWIECSDEYSINNGKLNYPIAVPSVDDMDLNGYEALTGTRSIAVLDSVKESYLNNGYYYIYPSIYLHGGFILEGEGSEQNPFTIKE